MIPRRTLLTGLLAFMPGLAAAHVQPGTRGPNGGPMADLGPYHSELVAKDGELTLFLYDLSDRPVRLPEASATALLVAEGRQQTLTFTPRPDGASLAAAGDFRVVPGLRVVVQLTPAPGQPRVQARFTPADAPR